MAKWVVGCLCCLFPWLLRAQQAPSELQRLLDSVDHYLPLQLDTAWRYALKARLWTLDQQDLSQSLKALDKLAQVALQKGDFQQASQPDCPPQLRADGHNTQGVWYYRQGDLWAAGEAFLKAAHASQMNAAAVLMNTGGVDRAYALFEQISQDSSADQVLRINAYSNRGMIMATKSLRQEAQKHFLSAIALSRQMGRVFAPAYFNLALAYEEERQYRQALSLYQELIKHFQATGEQRMLRKALMGKAVCHAGLKQSGDALLCLDQVEPSLDTLLGGTLLIALILGFSLQTYRGAKAKDQLNRALEQHNARIALMHQELRHRINNNLAFITSLLQIQGRRLSTAEAQDALQQSQSRVRAISFLHQILQTEDQSDTGVPIKPYLSSIVEQLQHSFPSPQLPPHIHTQFADLSLEAETALRLGLIINELLTNAFKHAFKDGRQGEIHLSLQSYGPNNLRLSYRDNGTGLSEPDLPLTSQPLGMTLIHSLGTLCKGHTQFSSSQGMEYTLEFQHPHNF